ncbi:MAG: hypothetical protein HGGPFJEG_02559 [Ignavibacteria bacterium]|nr:hypothetical protein [Ignavibacteria bacterium]
MKVKNPVLKSIKRMSMTRWFDIGQLAQTGIRAIFSTFIGEQSDKRIIQALSSSGREFFDYTYMHGLKDGKVISLKDEKRDEIWIDYAADVGDGWNSTYTISYYISKRKLILKSGEKTFHTQRGDLLIFGGDEVYPTPSRENYKRKLLEPYETAFGDDNPDHNPHVFAIPGNHDWYDGLTAFARLFCSDLERQFAGWFTRQKRSYFALKLPGKWWLFASDGQLQSDIDTPQIEYFRKVSEKMEKGDNVILCISQPNWIYAEKYKKFGELYDESDLIYLQKEILDKKNIQVKVYLSGDYHHYRRHEEKNSPTPESKVQKITAGGGGAFLHPTHDVDVSEISDDYKSQERFFTLEKSYPDIKTSKRLTFRNLLFLFYNPGFGILTAIIYLLTTWIVVSSFEYSHLNPPSGFAESFIYSVKLTLLAFMKNPIAGIWIILLLIAFIFFTDTHSKIYKYLGGFLHCWAHLSAIFYLSWLIIIIIKFSGDVIYVKFITAFVLIFISGWIVGSIIFGIYLFISQYFFGRHSEESFSAFRCQDYKNFLRLHIKGDGTLEIYPVKIDRVPRKWRDRSAGESSEINSLVVPADGTAAELIEDPILIHPEKKFI